MTTFGIVTVELHVTCFCELLYLRIYCIENDFAILELLKVKILLFFSEYVYNV